MAIPRSQMWAVTRYLLRNRLQGRKRYPLVLMLEPLFRCNLSCAGCGKIQYPPDILKKSLSVEKCLEAADECGAPVVSVAGGEPLLHPQIGEIVDGLISQGRYVYLCTNALLLAEKLSLFRPSSYLSISVHLDGLREEHDKSVCREGVFDKAVEGIKEAVKQGFRVTTNTTFYNTHDPDRARAFFDFVMDLGVEGMMISPGYPYERAPDRERFLHRRQTVELFRKILYNPKKTWVFNQSPLFLEFLGGIHDFNCTPWGNPTFNLFGWQRPCYLLEEGYARSFKELLEETDWSAYGPKSGNPKCEDCMLHCGFEATAVHYTFSSLRGFARTVRAFFKGPYIPPPDGKSLVPQAAPQR